MPTYRFETEASICLDIVADTEEAARERLKVIADEDEGESIDVADDVRHAVVYFNPTQLASAVVVDESDDESPNT